MTTKGQGAKNAQTLFTWFVHSPLHPYMILFFNTIYLEHQPYQCRMYNICVYW